MKLYEAVPFDVTEGHITDAAPVVALDVPATGRFVP